MGTETGLKRGEWGSSEGMGKRVVEFSHSRSASSGKGGV